MALTRRGYILSTCLLSGIATVIALVSLATEQWVRSDAKEGSMEAPSDVNFGLFGGVFRQVAPVRSVTDLTMTCLAKENICALLCDLDGQSDMLREIYNGKKADINNDVSCMRVNTVYDYEVYYRTYNSPKNTTASTPVPTKDHYFFNAAIRGLTIFFLVVSISFGAVSSILAFWNVVYNPYQTYLSVFALYFYNATAACGSMLTLILWGAMFSDKIRPNNIPMPATLANEFKTAGLPALGYSYWINIASLSLFILSIALLYVRQYLIAQEPKVNVHLEDRKDSVIYLY